MPIETMKGWAKIGRNESIGLISVITCASADCSVYRLCESYGLSSSCWCEGTT